MIFHTSGVRGMIATEEKVVIPSNDDVLEVGRERSVGILTEVILKNVDSVSVRDMNSLLNLIFQCNTIPLNLMKSQRTYAQ